MLLQCLEQALKLVATSVKVRQKLSQSHRFLCSLAGPFSFIYQKHKYWHDFCNSLLTKLTSKAPCRRRQCHLYGGDFMPRGLRTFLCTAFSDVSMVTGVSLLGILAALVVATAVMFWAECSSPDDQAYRGYCWRWLWCGDQSSKNAKNPTVSAQ